MVTKPRTRRITSAENKHKVISRPSRIKAKIREVKKMEHTIQTTDSRKVAEAMRNIRGIFMNARENATDRMKEEWTLEAKKYEK